MTAVALSIPYMGEQLDLERTHDRTRKERMTPLEDDKTTLPEQDRDRETDR